MASRASRCKARRQSPSLVPSSKHDPICATSVQCVLSISFAPCILGQTRRPRASTDHSWPCRFSEVLLTPQQTWRSRARKIKSVPCRFSQSLQCFPLNPRANTAHSAPCRLSQKPATSNMSEPFCALPALSRLATSNNLDPPAPCLLSQSGHRVIVLSNRTNFIAPHERFGPQD